MDPNEITVVAHPRPQAGVSTHSGEALTAWTPVLGPTAMLLAYRLAGDVERDGAASYRLNELATDLGVMPSKLTAAIKRLHRLDVALVNDDDIAIRLTLGTPVRQQQRAESATLTVPEAADILGISRGKAYDAARNGEIPAVRIGRRFVVPRARLMQMLNDPEE